MAFIADQEEDEEGKKGTPAAAPMSATIGTGAPQAASAAPEGSGSFTNVRQYIEANKPKTQEMTKAITSGISGEAQQAKGDIAAQREKSLGVGSQIGQEQQRLAGGEQFIQETIAGAGTGAAQAGADRFAKLREQYKPSFAAPELTQQRASAQDLERRAQAFGTEAGRREELARTVGKQSPSYTSGQQSLDTLLLSGDRGARQKSIKDIQSATKGLGGQVGQLGTDIQARLGEQEAERSRLAGVAETQLGTAREGLKGQLETKRAEQQAQQQELQNRFTTATTGRQKLDKYGQPIAGEFDDPTGGLSQEDIQALGLDRGITDFFDYNPSDVFRFGDVTTANVANQEQQARANALAQLAGRAGSEYLPQDAALGGSSLTVDQEMLQALQAKGKEYGTQKSIIQSEKDKAMAQWGIKPEDLEKFYADPMFQNPGSTEPMATGMMENLRDQLMGFDTQLGSLASQYGASGYGLGPAANKGLPVAPIQQPGKIVQ